MRCNVNIEKDEEILWADIDSIKNHYEVNPYPEDGTMFKTTSGDTYVYHDGEFSRLNMEASGLNMSLYDLNKAVIQQLNSLTEEEIKDKCYQFVKALREEYSDEYYMLYGKEIGYFTLFHVYEYNSNLKSLDNELELCLKDLSDNIKIIEWNEDSTALEIWIEYNGDVTCLYMFPYDSGVIECRGV